jgi:rhodanese-related sulfurtransferase
MRLIGTALLLVLVFCSPTDAGRTPFWWSSAKAEAEREGYALLDSPELERLISEEDPILVDVRPKYEYSAGYIACALNLDFDPGDRHSLTPEKREAFLSIMGWDKKRPVIVYCRNPQ